MGEGAVAVVPTLVTLIRGWILADGRLLVGGVLYTDSALSLALLSESVCCGIP